MPSEEEKGTPLDLVHGQLCYLQIPATDTAQSVSFYEGVFGWDVDPAGSSFTLPGLIGQFTSEQPVAAESGVLLWIHVEDMKAALASVARHGGDVVQPPTPDGPARWLATVRDPAGNLIGIAQHGQ
ncbi:MAG: VOC family protein [Alicyclobacillus sp.]|nr:VOC family protein [Alicyclobacillus sp.]